MENKNSDVDAAKKESKMRAFFDRLKGPDRRRLRQAAARVTGRKESVGDMMVRLARIKK